MLKKCFDIAFLTVAYDIKGVFFFKADESIFEIRVENTAVFAQIAVFVFAAFFKKLHALFL